LSWKPGGFGIPSGLLCRSFGSSSGAPEGFREDSRRIPEENNKKTGIRYEEYLFCLVLKKLYSIRRFY